MNRKIKLKINHVLKSNHFASAADAHELIKHMSGRTDVMLDFTGIENVGEEFVHELLVVWKKQHPEVTMEVVGAFAQVEYTIMQVLKNKRCSCKI